MKEDTTPRPMAARARDGFWYASIVPDINTPQAYIIPGGRFTCVEAACAYAREKMHSGEPLKLATLGRINERLKRRGI